MNSKSSKLVQSKSTNNLGPGEYSVDSNIGKNGPKFSFRGKP